MALWKKILDGLLDIVFPQEKSARKIREMEARELREAIPAPNFITDQSITSALCYKNPLTRSLIWNIKYRGNTDFAKKAAELLYDEILAHISEHSFFHERKYVLIPIPISKERLKERGWNQMALVGKALEEIDQNNSFLYRPDILEKIRHTDSQTKTHSKKEREKNLQGCFAVKDHKRIELKKKHVILIDDVYTTGSTIREARRALVRAGALSVTAFTIAH